MRLKPGQKRCLVKRQRFGVMKMAAGGLAGGATGIKDSGALFRRQAGEFQVLEPDSGHGGNFGPVPDGFRISLARPAKLAIWRIVGELEAEKSQSMLVKLIFSVLEPAARPLIGTGIPMNELAQLRYKA